MTALYSIEKYRLEAEKIVREDVIFCHSSLVSDLLQNPEVCEKLDISWDDLLNISSKLDYEEHARENVIPDMDAHGAWYWLYGEDKLPEGFADEPEDFDNVTPAELETMRAAVVQALDDSDEWQEFCEDQRSEPDATEAYEHWHVSGWLSRRLDEQGEMVGEVYGMPIWGRTCSGQAICMDHVILSIAKTLVDEREASEAATLALRAKD